MKTLILLLVASSLWAAPQSSSKGKKEKREERGSRSAFMESKASARRLEDFADVLITAPRSVSGSPDLPSVQADQVEVQAHLTCYGTNLRAASHPMDGCGTLHMDLTIREIDKVVTIDIPAQMVKVSSGSAERGCQAPGKLQAAPSDKVLALTMDPRSKLLVAKLKKSPSFMVFKKDGSYSGAKRPTNVSSVSFRQTLARGDNGRIGGQGINNGSGSQGFGQNGAVTHSSGYQVSADGKLIKIYASLPGEVGHCGSFVSPLMVFMSDARPDFTGRSKFPLYPDADTYWVEPQAPGYFLAMDRDLNGKIDKADELFGNVSAHNGFQELKKLDSNKDGTISKKDHDFSRLQLWRDINGDGVSEKFELKSLADLSIDSFPLKYRSDSVRDFGHRARIREVAELRAKGAQIADVWFGKVP